MQNSVKEKILQKAVSRNPLSISKLNAFDGLGSNTKYLEVCKHQILLLKTSGQSTYMGNAPICKLFETQEKIISSLLIDIAFVKLLLFSGLLGFPSIKAELFENTKSSYKNNSFRGDIQIGLF